MVASHVLSLPIFEPLSRDRLERLSHVTLGSLRAAITATTAVSGASNVSEDIESAADLIVQQSVSDCSYTRTLIISTLFSTSFLFLKLNALSHLLRALSTSTRVSGRELRNVEAQAAEVLLQGLTHLLQTPAASTDKYSDHCSIFFVSCPDCMFCTFLCIL